MPQITDIKPQKRKERFNISLDGKFAFGVSAEIFAKTKLTKDKELTEEQILQLIKEDEFSRVFDRALKFLSYRPRSEKELQDWLKRKEIGEMTQKLVLEKLKDLNIIDDFEFAKWWIEQRTTFKNIGKKVIKLELIRKGISEEITNSLVDEINLDQELAMARKIIAKKRRILKLNDQYEVRKKVTQILASRGFSWEIIKQIIDEKAQEE